MPSASPLGPDPGDRSRRKSQIGRKDQFVETGIQTLKPNEQIKIKVPVDFLDHIQTLCFQKDYSDFELFDRARLLLRTFKERVAAAEKTNFYDSTRTIFDLQRKRNGNRFSDLYLEMVDRFSDIASFDLSESERKELKDHILKYEFDEWFSVNKFRDDKEFLDSALFLILKLSFQHEKLKRQEKQNELTQEHLDMINRLRALVVYRVDHEFKDQTLSVHPENYYFSAVREITQKHPEVKDFLNRLIVDWEGISVEGEGFIDDLYESNTADESTDFSFVDDSSRTTFEAVSLESVARDFEEVVYPNTPTKNKAWTKPVEYLVELASNVNLTCIEFTESSNIYGDLASDVYSFHLEWIKELSERKYTNFALEGSIYFDSFFLYFQDKKEYKSTQEINEIVQKCFDEDSKWCPNFRSELGLPRIEEDESVDVSVEFLEDLWEIKKSSQIGKIQINFYHITDIVGAVPLNKIVDEKKNEKLAIIKTADNCIVNGSDKGVFIKHSLGTNDYGEDEADIDVDDEPVFLEQVIGKAAFEVSRSKKPASSNNSVVIPIRDNDELLNAVNENLLQTVRICTGDEDISMNEGLFYPAFNEDGATSYHYRHANLITLFKDDDDDQFADITDPVIYSGSPLVGA